MKHILSLMIAVSFLCAESRVLGVNPWLDPERLHKMYEPIVRHLSKETGEEFELLVSKDYKDLIALIKQGVVDIASISPNLYVEAKKQIPGLHYVATMSSENAKGETVCGYKGVIITLKDSNIKTLKDLKGKTFGFTDIESTSGYLVPMLVLEEAGVSKEDFKKYYMLKKHDRVVEAVVNRSIDAGATYDEVLIEGVEKYGELFEILKESDEIPYDAIVISPNKEESFKNSVKKAILNYKSHPSTTGEPTGFKDLGDSAYDVIRKLNKRLYKN